MDLAAKWDKTGRGRAAAGAVCLVLAYGLASWAIDSGNLLAYVLTVVFLVIGMKNFILAAKRFFNKHER